MKTNLEEFKNFTKKSLSESSIHGLNRIFKSKDLAQRTFWSIIFTIFSIISLISVYTSILEFIKYPTSTVVRDVYEPDSAFPRITFCDIDKFSKKESYIQYDQKNSSKFGVFSDYNDHLLLSGLMLTSKLGTLNESSKEQFYNPINESIISCIYNSRTCKQEEFFYFTHPFFGPCITFNTKERLKNTGPTNGLNINVLLEPLNKKNNMKNARGLAVMIENETSIFESYASVYTAIRKRTSINVRRILRKKLPEPYSKCIRPDQNYQSLYKIKFGLNFTYTQRNCEKLCLNRYIAEKCSCSVPGYHKFNMEIPCLDKQQVTCANNIYTETTNKFDERCLDECLVECEKVDFSITTSISTFSNDYLIKKLINETFISKKYPNITVSEMAESLTSVTVFYSDLKYVEYIDRAQYNLGLLFSNLGGLLGLFLGFSVGSLFEIIEIIFALILLLYKELKQRIKKN